jgi:hypothetical protein
MTQGPPFFEFVGTLFNVSREGLIYSPLVMCYEECSTERETHPCTNRPLQKSHSSNIANPPAENGSSTK